MRAGILTKREMLCLRYRWEFLRRNMEYQKDYAHITGTLKVGDIVKNRYPDDLVRKVLEILSKWDLINPIPPKFSFDTLVRSDKKLKSFYLDSLVIKEMAIDSPSSPDSLSLKDVYVKGSMVKICIDMKFPKEKILDEFNLLVDSWQKRLKEVTKAYPNLNPETRLQIDQYDQYLKVYDEHRKGMSFKKLAKKFYSIYIESSGKDYAERKVLRDINSCLRLIHGGYKQIR